MCSRFSSPKPLQKTLKVNKNPQNSKQNLPPPQKKKNQAKQNTKTTKVKNIAKQKHLVEFWFFLTIILIQLFSLTNKQTSTSIITAYPNIIIVKNANFFI